MAEGIPTLRTLDAVAALVRGARIAGEGATVVRDLTYDSRTVTRGSLFFCVPGARADGHAFAADAVAHGAAALVVERSLDVTVPQLVVPSVREAMGAIAAPFFGDPSSAMPVLGVTGTNGKTTTTFMLASVIRSLGVRPGLIGTVEARIGDRVIPGARTTPEAIDLQRLLAAMRDEGAGGVAMEVSSHGLAFGRVTGTRFACAAFTNLSPDHLDMHGSMEAYFEAKALLFDGAVAAAAVINVGDDWGARLRERTALPTVTFALEAEADVRALSWAMDARGSDLTADVGGERVSFRVPVAGRFNVANALGVLAMGAAMRWPVATVAAGIEALPGVPGRFESVDVGQDFTVIVDYAHTPDALASVLEAAREITPPDARLWVVVGCGGDRDTTKRAPMGRIAAAGADRCIITSDNPRSEDPDAIVAQIMAGAREAGGSAVSIVDRRAAIAAALHGAETGDVVVIAGKGHEGGQEFADRVIPFDDRGVAREILEERGG